MSFKMRFFHSLILFSAIVSLLGFILFSTLLNDYFQPVYYLVLIYFILLTVAGRLVLLKNDFPKTGDFNNRYFIVRWAKVLLHLLFITIYLLIQRDNILAFILTFMTGYVLFSFYDIYTLSFYLKKSNQN